MQPNKQIRYEDRLTTKTKTGNTRKTLNLGKKIKLSNLATERRSNNHSLCKK